MPTRDDLERELRQLKSRVAELEKQLAEARTAGNEVPPPTPTSAPELEQTLGRLVKRIAMILQAEKCVFMLHNPEAGELVARRPALGFTDDQLQLLRVRATQGVSGEAFRENKAVIVDDAVEDERTAKENVALLNIKNMLTVPLITEERDEQERVVRRTTVGVLHVFNKRFGGNFTQEDVRLLTILARQAAAVIANAQLYIKLAEEKEKLEATLESLIAGVVVVDPTGRITLINPAACQIFGIPSDNGVGKPYHDVIRDERVKDMIQSSLRERGEAAMELEINVSSVPRIYQGQTALVRSEHDGGMLGIVAIFSDITDIRNVERMKTAFVSTVSHELRTPLTAIKGFISTLIQDTEGYFDQETRQEFYQIIDQECDRLKRLIEDLLNISRIESGKALQMNWKHFHPRPVLEKVASTQRASTYYTDKHRIVENYQDPLPEIVADEDKFEQILHNLIGNALKYSPHGGDVTIKAWSDAEYLFVSISDQGIGIPPDKVHKVFERFERVDRPEVSSITGTGLGLYLVHHLVEQCHEGKIWVESEPGNGSTFTFKLPIYPEKAKEEMERLT